jgi:hypothetical protein
VNSEPNLDHRACLHERLIESRGAALDGMLRQSTIELGHLLLIAGIAAAGGRV